MGGRNQVGKKVRKQKAEVESFSLLLLLEFIPLFAHVVPTSLLTPLPKPSLQGHCTTLPRPPSLDRFPWLTEMSVLGCYTCLPQGQVSTSSGLPLGITCLTLLSVDSGPGSLETILILMLIPEFLHLDSECLICFLASGVM